MSLYREARGRTGWTAAVAGVVVVAALAAGFGLGVLVRSDDSLADAMRGLRADVAPALDALELVPLHYESTNPQTRRAAAAQLAAARDAFDRSEEDLRLLDPAATRAVARDLTELDRLVGGNGAPDEVDRLARDASSRLAGIVGARDPGRG